MFCGKSALFLRTHLVLFSYLGVGDMSKIEGQIRIPSGCAIAAVLSREGRLMTGETIIESMKPMHDRSNGLGGGFAAYGIYPEYRDFFALHLFLEDRAARKNCEAFLRETMEILQKGGLQLLPIGSGISFKQSPPPGTTLNEGDAVTVWFR